MVSLWPGQNSFAYFGLFSNFQQKYSFLRSVGFLKMKTLLRGRKSLQKNENRSTLLGRPLYSVPGVGGSQSFERMCGWGGRRATRHNEVRGFRRFVLFSLQHITSSLQRAPFPEFDFTYLFSISASNTVVWIWAKSSRQMSRFSSL